MSSNDVSVVLNEQINKDRMLARSVSDAANRELSSIVDISPELATQADYVGWKLDQVSSLRAIRTAPFFARVDTTVSGKSGDGDKECYLVSKCRLSAVLFDEHWEIISWTNPFTASLLDREHGDVFTSGKSQFLIGNSGRFSEVLPELTELHYRLSSGEYRLETPEDAVAPVEILQEAEAPVTDYTAAESFELGEIIELADSSQRTAMHLPFDETIVVEGPPGSGKTSIGIMRIPCLIDRQWEELGLDPKTNRGYHAANTMRILVFNDEMVSYLDSLTRSLGVQGVPVSTLGDFFIQVCREAKTLTGRPTDDLDDVAYVKAHPLALEAFWAGFKNHIHMLWKERGDEFVERFGEYGTMGESLARGLASWVDQVKASSVIDGTVPFAINLAARSAAWHDQAMARIPEKINVGHRASFSELRVAEERDKEISEWRDRVTSIVKVLREFTSAVLARHSAVRSMFQTVEYQDLLSSCVSDGMSQESVDVASLKWQEQYESDRPKYSEYDVSLAAWLGVHVSIAPSSGPKPVIGSQLPMLTHVVVDEAQDVSPTHAAVLRRLIDRKGTMTFVGDLNQHLKVAGGLRNWNDLGMPDSKRAVFNVNYRQTFELGDFVRTLHRELFGSEPVWEASPKRSGPSPRVRTTDPAIDNMVPIISEEISFWREEIDRCTIGVLFDGPSNDSELEDFHESVEEAVEELLVPVYLIRPDSRDRAILKTDCVIIAPIEATKGLEFDVVILLDNADSDTTLGPGALRRKKNALYVAASRARQGLTICSPAPSPCMTNYVF